MKPLRVAIIILPLIAGGCNERAPRATKQPDDSGVVSTSRVHTVEFSPDGKRMVTAPGDGTNKVPDAQSDLDPGTSKNERTQVFHASGRPDIDTDIPLASAVRRANAQFPDVQPLTEEEVIAAVRAIKLMDPQISDPIYDVYQRVVTERVLPRGMYFSHIPGWTTQYGHFVVDWKDLSLDSERAGIKGVKPGTGYNYRIRARFISSRPPNGGGEETTR